MGSYKLISHTADAGIEVKGKSIEEIFFYSTLGLYEIAGVEQGEVKGKKEIDIEADTIEELLIKFLNELIYYINVKGLAGEIEKIEIKKDIRYKIRTEINMRKIEKFEKEVKAATYHNISIRKRNGEFITTIIFDL